MKKVSIIPLLMGQRISMTFDEANRLIKNNMLRIIKKYDNDIIITSIYQEVEIEEGDFIQYGEKRKLIIREGLPI